MLEVVLTDAPDVTPEAVVTDGDATEIRAQAGKLARGLRTERSVLAPRGLAGSRLAAFVEGLVLGAYVYTEQTTPRRPHVTRVELVGVDDEAALERGLRAARAQVLARDLTNTRASQKTPDWLVRTAGKELRDAGAEVEIRDVDWLVEHGFEGVLAVGSGAAAPPRFLEARWRPRGARSGTHVVLVGKGITYDTGGINRKVGAGMRNMHTDMGGGAAVVGALQAIVAAKLPLRVTALVPCAENSLSGSSMRPGDVLRHPDGRTTEISNTDAEGRLVLADAMAYAVARLRPSALVDIATLTGPVKVALGLHTAGFFATDERLAGQLLAAGEATGEPLWRLPLVEEYRELLHSDVADAISAPPDVKTLIAALFLQPFAGEVPWAHLDIAGTARADKAEGATARGATGFGARLLARWVEDLASRS